jgi:hypothetical protein
LGLGAAKTQLGYLLFLRADFTCLRSVRSRDDDDDDDDRTLE